MQILLVDDDTGSQAGLEKFLKMRGHRVFPADTVDRALSVIAKDHIDLVITKRILPDGNGMALCRRIRSLDLGHYIHLLLLLVPSGLNQIAEIVDSGVDDVAALPFDEKELTFKLRLADRMVALERELNQKFLAIKRNYFQTIDVLTKLLDVYSQQVGGHCHRVGKLALALAKRHPGVAAQDYPIIEACGRLHDVGLIGLPSSVLEKRRTELCGDETELYRSHSERGEAILNSMDLLRPVARLVRMHHEQYNGRGFPDGLSGEQIPMAAAIVSAASIYDDFVHREGVPFEDIPSQLQQLRGYQLDPELVELLLEANLAHIQEEARKTEHLIAIGDLSSGMILSQDLHMKSGAFLMSAGTALDEALIEKLKRYHQSGNIFDKVSIKK